MNKFTNLFLKYILSSNPSEGEVYHITPVKNCGPRGRHKKVGVDRSSGLIGRCYTHKNPPAEPCPYGIDDAVPSCCAAHLKEWRELNPGNGRYVNEKWTDPDFVFGKPLFKRFWAFEEYLIEQWYHDGCKKFRLTIEEVELCFKDCLIDAQRVAARHMRLRSNIDKEN